MWRHPSLTFLIACRDLGTLCLDRFFFFALSLAAILSPGQGQPMSARCTWVGGTIRLLRGSRLRAWCPHLRAQQIGPRRTTASLALPCLALPALPARVSCPGLAHASSQPPGCRVSPWHTAGSWAPKFVYSKCHGSNAHRTALLHASSMPVLVLCSRCITENVVILWGA